ncbi:hypothetical protein EON65_51085 [archaeon]|nr:MAG: hypothetical protein EON65_51085 [archaeon]
MLRQKIASYVMIGGILSFFIQWLALNHFGALYNYYPDHPTADQTPSHHYPHRNYPIPQAKTPYSLLSELQHLKDDEIELYLPQICNILVEEGGCIDPGVYAYFQHIIVTKCEDNLAFGLRMCNALKVRDKWLIFSLPILTLVLST